MSQYLVEVDKLRVVSSILLGLQLTHALGKKLEPHQVFSRVSLELQEFIHLV